jgi:hypothetical protein
MPSGNATFLGSLAIGGNLDVGTNAITATDAAVNISTNAYVGGDLFVNDSAKKVSAGSTGIDISTNTVITGNLNANMMQFTVDIDTTSTPSALGILGINTSDYALYISTGLTPGGWQRVGQQ